MSKNLVIVESPAKAKTISRFLGSDYKVLASMGHIRDLPKSKMGIDIKNDFEPSYIVSADKKKVVKQLRDELKKAGVLWIATDEDREGEAIGWHLLSALEVKKKTPVKRIVFHEITEKAIKDSLQHPRDIDENVVHAQQARRVLDRLVGYELSPLLWKKVRPGLSAGRVQSVAVRLVVEKEREIEAFKPQEYWKIIGQFEKEDKKLSEREKTFEAELQKFEGKKLEVNNGDQAQKIENDLNGALYRVVEIEEKEVSKHPAPPFITSTLQQEASRKLGFSVKKTMMVAQQLYEGVDTGKGETGLITYMRTDSVNLSEFALKTAKEVIDKEFGAKFSLDSPRRYKVSKGAQEAHEAIRPVDFHLKPQEAARFLDRDQSRLYELIWKRALACQMKEAILNKVGADIEAFQGEKSTGYSFRATGQTVVFPGFMEVYMEGYDQEEEESQMGEKFLPKLSKDEKLDLLNLQKNQHFTKPPARYTEASLVKKLESEGIGRPSTYAPTIGTIVARGYIEKEGKALKPTDLAMVVTDFLVKYFDEIVDYKFTAEMEEKLDDIEEGKRKWALVIKEFYSPFHKNIEEKTESVSKADVMKERVLGKDPKTGLDVVARHGRFGPYVQVGNYTKEELDAMEEKPSRASLPKGCYIESVTLEEALKALQIPRNLGKTKEGEEVIVNIGRFGPYLKVGAVNVSLPKEMDPYTVKLEDLPAVLAAAKDLKKKKEPIKEFGEDPTSGGKIFLMEGRFGPYVTDGKTNASIPKSIDVDKVDFQEAIVLLDKKRNSPKRSFFRKK